MHGVSYISVFPISGELKYQWKTSRRENSVDFLRPAQSDGACPFPYVKLYLQYFHPSCFSLE